MSAFRREKGNNVSGLVNFHAQTSEASRGNLHGHHDAGRGRGGNFTSRSLHRMPTRYDPAFRGQLSGLSRQLQHAGASGAGMRRCRPMERLYRGLPGAVANTWRILILSWCWRVLASIMFALAFNRSQERPGRGWTCRGRVRRELYDQGADNRSRTEYGEWAPEEIAQRSLRTGSGEVYGINWLTSEICPPTWSAI